MIVVNRVYTVLSVLALVLITIFYLIYIGKNESRSYDLYIQGNSTYALQSTSSYSDLSVFNSSTLAYNIKLGKVFLDSYEGYTRTGRFILMFSQPGQINLKVNTDTGENIGNIQGENLSPYYPVYVNFHAPNSAKYINLQYYTTLQSIILYKLSIEFF